MIVTHRIAEIQDNGGQKTYSTKGDANRSEDEDSISYSQIIGKVVLVIPKLGYYVAYAKSLPGLMLLLVLPALIYILDELLKIRNAKSHS
jgi:signal peptidase